MFYNSPVLETIVLPNTVTEIGYYAFHSCTKLKSVTGINNVTLLDGFTFTSCESLEIIDLGKKLQEIGGVTFAHCKNLTSISIPGTVIHIGEVAFWNCSKLKEVILEAGTDILEFEVGFSDNIFNGTSVESLYLERHISRVNPFTSLPLKSITVGKTISSFNHLFHLWSPITEVLVSEQSPYFTSVDGVLYSRDKKAIVWYPRGKENESYSIQKGTTEIGAYSFALCRNITSIVLPEGVEVIRNDAFAASALSSIVIPDDVKEIESYAFGESSISSITLGEGVTSIGKDAFTLCFALKEIKVKALTPPGCELPTTPGDDVDKNTCVLYVPSGTLSAYRSAPYWKDFKNILESEDGNSINNDSYSETKVYAYSGSLIIRGAEIGELVSIYSESGVLIRTVEVDESTMTVELPKNNMYIVKTADKTFKVIL